MFSDVIILAGGAGERLWPASTSDEPKQFMRLFNGKSFLQETLLRALSLEVSGRIVIITRKNWLEKTRGEIKNISNERVVVLGEPCGKNTAPAAALGAKFLISTSQNKNPNILILPSDHIILDNKKFITNMEDASIFTAQKKIAVFGVQPLNAETGFGYIEAGAEITEHNANKKSGVYNVAAFKEKPDKITAEKYVASKKYFWNSGIYGFRADFYFEELARYSPEISNVFLNIDFNASLWEEKINAAYSALQSLSIDYAVSEKSRDIVMVKADFDWDDAGSWDSIAKYEKVLADKKIIEVNGKNNFVFGDIPAAFCGVDDIILVIKNGKALVMKKGSGNDVKKIIEAAK